MYSDHQNVTLKTTITGSGNRNNTSTKSGMTQDTRYVLAEDESLVTTTTKPLHILSMAGGWTSYKVSIKTVVTESVGNTSNSRSSSQHVSAIASIKTVSHTSDRNNRYMTSPQFSVMSTTEEEELHLLPDNVTFCLRYNMTLSFQARKGYIVLQRHGKRLCCQLRCRVRVEVPVGMILKITARFDSSRRNNGGCSDTIKLEMLESDFPSSLLASCWDTVWNYTRVSVSNVVTFDFSGKSLTWEAISIFFDSISKVAAPHLMTIIGNMTGKQPLSSVNINFTIL